MMPILAATAIAIDVDPALLMFPAVLACSAAFMLPVATAPNAIAYGSGMVESRRMFNEGIMLNVFAVTVVCLVCWLAFS
jgi:sodium-dependent dicarboxylate transporter 2/3/5